MSTMQTTLVRDGRTFRALEKAGLIKEPPENMRPKGAKWGRDYAYVDAEAGTLKHKGRKFTVSYQDGCFFPFVYEQHGGNL